MAVAAAPQEGATDERLSGFMDAAGGQVDQLDNEGQAPSQNVGTVEDQLQRAQVEDSRWAAHLEGLLNMLERAGTDPSIDENKLRAAISDARSNKRGWQDFIGDLGRTRGAIINE